MLSLKSRGVIKSMEFNSFTRIHHEDTEIKVQQFIDWLELLIPYIFLQLQLGGETNADYSIE